MKTNQDKILALLERNQTEFENLNKVRPTVKNLRDKMHSELSTLNAVYDDLTKALSLDEVNDELRQKLKDQKMLVDTHIYNHKRNITALDKWLETQSKLVFS